MRRSPCSVICTVSPGRLIRSCTRAATPTRPTNSLRVDRLVVVAARDDERDDQSRLLVSRAAARGSPARPSAPRSCRAGRRSSSAAPSAAAPAAARTSRISSLRWASAMGSKVTRIGARARRSGAERRAVTVIGARFTAVVDGRSAHRGASRRHADDRTPSTRERLVRRSARRLSFKAMFDELSEKLEATFARLRGRGVLTEADIKEGLREVRRVLLEADVNFQLTREFLERVEKKAVGVSQLQDRLARPAARQDRLRRAHRDARRAARRAQAELGPADRRHDGRAAGLRKDDDRRQARAQAQGRGPPDAPRRRRRLPPGRHRPARDARRSSSTSRSTPSARTKDVVQDREGTASSRRARARDRVVHRRHRRPAADRRRDDGRARAAQGGRSSPTRSCSSPTA